MKAVISKSWAKIAIIEKKVKATLPFGQKGYIAITKQ